MYILVTFMISSGTIIRPSTASSYIAMTTWMFGGTILSMSYASSLISMLTSPSHPKTIETFQELVQSDYKITTQDSGYMQRYMMDSRPDVEPTLYKLWQRIKEQVCGTPRIEILDGIF